MLPKVLAGCLIGAFVTLLLPRELVARWVGHESGFAGLLIAALYLAQRPTDILVVMGLLPLIAGAFGAGILWGELFLRKPTTAL